MIPVDLNRLREARGRESMTGTDQLVIDETLSAVLDAPTVWWCEWGYDKPTEGCRTGEHVKTNAPCGWVALVPVKGKS